MRRHAPLPNEYFLNKEEVYKAVSVSRGTDEVFLEKLSTGEIGVVMFSVFQSAFKRVWKVGDVAKILGRSPRSIYRYEAQGRINKPKTYADRHGRRLRFYTKDDVLELHECISSIHQGRPRSDNRVVNNTMPGRAEVLEVFRERFKE